MRLLLYALICLAAPAPALACDCVRLDPSYPRFQSDLDAITAYYPVAAEGLLEADGEFHWRFKPTREFRGPGKPSYRIDLISDCSLDPAVLNSLIGKTVFLLLAPGEGDHRGSYGAGRCVNLQSPAVETAMRARFERPCRPSSP